MNDNDPQSEQIKIKVRAMLFKAMGMLFLGGVMLFGAVGFGVTKIGMWAIPVCIVAGIVGIGIGVAIGVLRFHDTILEFQMDYDRTHRKQMRRVIEATQKECGGFAVESARVVANHVVNRIIARHASGLLNSEHREATLTEANEIVSEELDAFEATIMTEGSGVFDRFSEV